MGCGKLQRERYNWTEPLGQMMEEDGVGTPPSLTHIGHRPNTTSVMSVSFFRTLKNVWRNGLRRSGRQVAYMNDTKSGTLVGEDDFGNKYYETNDPAEIHMRTRWVEYKDFWRYDASHAEPGWHYWLAYGTDVAPNKLKKDEVAVRHIAPQAHHPVNLTFTKGAFVPYNTAKPKYQAWEPKVNQRA